MMMNFQQTLKQSAYFFKNNFTAICLTLLPCIVLIQLTPLLFPLIEGEAFNTSNLLIALMVKASLYPLYKGALLLLIAARANNRHASLALLYKMAARYWGSILLTAIIGGVLMSIGLALFILPGVYLYARFIFAQFNVVFRDQSPIDALVLSWQQTQQYQWQIILMLLVVVPSIYLPALMILQMLPPETALFQAVGFMVSLAMDIALVFVVIFAFRVYSINKPNAAPQS